MGSVIQTWRVTYNPGDSASLRSYVVAAADLYEALDKARALDQSSLNREVRFEVEVKRDERVHL